MFCLILDDSMTIATDSHNCYFSWLSKDWTLDSLIECDAEGYSLAQRTADAIHQVSCSDWCPLATTKNQRQWSSSCWSWLSKSFSISRCLGTFGSFWVSNGTDHARQCHYDWISSFSSSRRERCQHFVYGLRFHLYLHLCLWTLSTGLARGFLGGRKGPLQTVLRVPTKTDKNCCRSVLWQSKEESFEDGDSGRPLLGCPRIVQKIGPFFVMSNALQTARVGAGGANCPIFLMWLLSLPPMSSRYHGWIRVSKVVDNQRCSTTSGDFHCFLKKTFPQNCFSARHLESFRWISEILGGRF